MVFFKGKSKFQVSIEKKLKIELPQISTYKSCSKLTINLKRIKHLYIPRRLLTKHRQQIQKILKGQIPIALPGERLANPPLERVLHQLGHLLDPVARHLYRGGLPLGHHLRHQLRAGFAEPLVHPQNVLPREERTVLVVLQLLVGESDHLVAHGQMM